MLEPFCERVASYTKQLLFLLNFFGVSICRCVRARIFSLSFYANIGQFVCSVMRHRCRMVIRLLCACLHSFSMPKHHNKGLINQLCDVVRKAAPRCKHDVCTTENGVGVGRRTL